MTTNPLVPVNLVNVHGIELLASDTRERGRQKLARITLDSMVQFVGLLDAKGTVLKINQVALDAVGIKLSDAPSRGEPQWGWITWGSVLTIIIWLGASVLFVWYAANFGSYNKTYGSLPAIIGFMTWNLAVQHRGSDRRAAQR